MRAQLPWKQLQSRVVFRNRYFTVREDTVRQPDGKRGRYAYIDHPGGGGAGVVAVDEKHNVFLVREYKYPVRAFGMHLPSGGIEPKETPLEAAKRELLEEIGVSARQWSGLGTIATSDGSSNEIAHLFFARKLIFKRVLAQSLEPLTVIRMPLRKAVTMALDGRITCSYAVAGIIRAAVKLRLMKWQ